MPRQYGPAAVVRHLNLRMLPLFFLSLALLIIAPVAASADIWVSAYYAGWMQGCSSAGNDGYLPAQDIDYTALTHVIHFAVEPYPDGTLNTAINCISPGNSVAVVQAAHAAGKKVLISVGGWDTETNFLSATNNTHRAAFISNLVAFMKNNGYDGIDIDWEPVSSASAPQLTAFVTELRAALNAITPTPIMTAAVMWEPALFNQLQSNFDQINLMTYELSGPWPGWITWHNSPLYDGGVRFSSTGALVPSANGMVSDFTSAGVQPAKLGIGIEFYGTMWQGGSGTPTGGVTAPEQSWTTAPATQSLAYYEIMGSYYNSSNYRWDSFALVPYLSMDNTGSSQDRFISYDDENSCIEKVKFVRDKAIGGLIIFELGGGWRPDQAVKDKLLQAVKNAVAGTSPNPAPTPPPAPTQTVISSFTGTSVSNGIFLSWSTSSEYNNKGFGIQRRLSGGFKWTNVTFVNGAGTTSDPKSYSYTDTRVKSGITYLYRLKQTNLDGSYTYSAQIYIKR